MLPTFNIGHFTIAGYGLMIVIGIACGLLLLWRHARRLNYPVQDALFAFFYGALGVAVGGKLFYLAQSLPQIIDHWPQISASPQLILSLLSSGFVFYGGLMGGIAGAFIYARQFHLPFIPLLQTVIPALPLVHAFGRIGCFLAGCCYGIPCSGPLCVVFPHSPVAPPNTPLFPVQLLESALLFLLTAILLLYVTKGTGRFVTPNVTKGTGRFVTSVNDKTAATPPRHSPTSSGVTGERSGDVSPDRSPVTLRSPNPTALYLLLYGIIRFGTEFLRGDLARGSLWLLSTSQWISLLAITTAILLFTLHPKRT